MTPNSRRISCSLLVASVLAACGSGKAIGPGNGESPGGSVAAPTFSLPAGTVAAGTQVTVSCATAGATLYTGQTNPPANASATFTVSASGTWYAQAKAGGQSSAVASATYAVPSGAPPAAPTRLTATPLSSSSIQLGWTDQSIDETSFFVERAPDAGGRAGTFAPVGSVGANVTSYPDTGLAAGTTYWYRVRTYGAGGYSAYGNSASAATASGGGGGSLTITTQICPVATQGQAYGCTIAASGGTPPYSSSVSTDAGFSPLPEGMSLDGDFALDTNKILKNISFNYPDPADRLVFVDAFHGLISYILQEMHHILGSPVTKTVVAEIGKTREYIARFFPASAAKSRVVEALDKLLSQFPGKA